MRQTSFFQVCLVTAVLLLVVCQGSPNKIQNDDYSRRRRDNQIYELNAIPEDARDIFIEGQEMNNRVPVIPLMFEKKYEKTGKDIPADYFRNFINAKSSRLRITENTQMQKYLNERFVNNFNKDNIRKILSWLTDEENDGDMLIFKNVDTDNNGFITWDEYTDNLDLSPTDINLLMQSYDEDGDKRVSADEYLRVKRWASGKRKGKKKKRKGKCNIQKIHKCGIKLLRKTYQNGKIACLSFKEYMQCIADKVQRCGKRQIFSAVAIFVHVLHNLQDVVTCTIPDLPKLALKKRDKSVPRELVLPVNAACIPATVMWCSTGLFLEIIHDGAGCAIIKEYKDCLNTATLMCKKRATKHIRNSYLAVKKACYRAKKPKLRV